MTGRATSEWVGKSADSKIPEYVQLRIWDREGGRCYLTGKKLRRGEYDFEHVIALALWTGDGHGNRESNIRLAYRPAHRDKTRQDVAAKAASDRVRKKHVLPRKPSKWAKPDKAPAPAQRRATTPLAPKFPGDIMARRSQ